MISPMRLGRVLHIARILGKYQLDDIAPDSRPGRLIRWTRRLTFSGDSKIAEMSRGQRVRLALQELGPIFVKFGQVLSTRRDVVVPDIADELALLQDQVAPFPGEQAKERIEKSLDQSIEELFEEFDIQPLASASIAQVHAATLPNGQKVVVKVLRPQVREKIHRDVALMQSLAWLFDRFSSRAKLLRPLEVVAEFEQTIYDELDMQREAANASQLRRNFEGNNDLYVPEVYWDYCRPDVFVMERIGGIPIDDLEALTKANVDFKALAESGIRIFYTQVFRDNFFHADMHPGNIRVDASDPANPTYIAMDFGIMGVLPPGHLHYLAENFQAFFNQDYRRVAELHIEAGWIPDTVRIDYLESAVRTVCEPQMAKSLSDISFAQVLMQLFALARKFSLIVQPELILLQKTLLNVEGLGRQLYPELDIWSTAKPELESILRQRLGFSNAAEDLRRHLPGWMEKTPQVPGLVYEFLKQANNGQLKVKLEQNGEAGSADQNSKQDKRVSRAILAAGLGISASVMFALNGPGPFYSELPIPAIVTGILSVFCAIRSWR